MAWCAEHTLVRNGNGVAVNIPRTFLHQLGWLAGRRVVLELTDTLDAVIVRLPQQSDFGIPGPPRIRRDFPGADK